MKGLTGFAASLALLTVTAAPPPTLAQERRGEPEDTDKRDSTAAVMAGLAVIGAGIAIASKHGKRHRHD